MRYVALIGVLVAALLGGCVRDPFVEFDQDTRSGDWWIARAIDRVTGDELPAAYVFASASNSNEDFPLASSLQLTCLGQQPIVRFAFAFKLGRTRNSVLGYRFDDKPGHENVPSRIATQVVVIEDKAAVAQFVSELKGSSKLYMRLRSLTAGRSSAEYPLVGSEEAVQAAFSKCSMQASPPPSQPQGRNS